MGGPPVRLWPWVRPSCAVWLLMSLGVGLEQELGDEFGVDFDEFDEFGGAFVWCFLACRAAFDEFGGVFDEFGRGVGTKVWR